MPFARHHAVEIHYEIHGPPRSSTAATPAVLIMGFGSDAHAWEKQIAALAAERPLLTLDNRGVGRSSKPPGPYTTAELADDLVAVLEAAEWPAAHIVGLSLGGLIAQELALRAPARVRSLALLATYAHADLSLQNAAEVGVAAASGGASVPGLLEALSRGAANVDFLLIFGYLTKLVFSPAYLKREGPYLQALFGQSLAYGFSIDGLMGQMQAALAHDTRSRLGTLNVPTLVVLGTADALVPPVLSRELAHLVPGARSIEVQNGTHGLNLENAEDVNKLLAAWFFENDQGESAEILRNIG